MDKIDEEEGSDTPGFGNDNFSPFGDCQMIDAEINRQNEYLNAFTSNC